MFIMFSLIFFISIFWVSFFLFYLYPFISFGMLIYDVDVWWCKDN